jgi:hypothetical protein
MVTRDRITFPTAVAAVVVSLVLLLAAALGGLPSSPGGGSRASDGNSPGASRIAAGFTSDVWQSNPAPVGFPGLLNAAVASDPVDHSLIVFGGCGLSTCTVDTNATWTESHGVWSELNTTVAPTARQLAQMAWDPADGYVLLFGGSGCLDPPICDQTGPLNDTWAFKDGTWNPVISSGPAPPPSDQGGLAYDPSDHEMVLFGGVGCAPACGTWTYSGGTWAKPNLTTQPTLRSAEGFAEDDAENGALLFGGISDGPTNQTYLGDTWLFSGGAWHNVTAPSSPSARQDPAMAWNPVLRAVVLFGGDDSPVGPDFHPSSLDHNDTWEFQDGSWSEWTGPTSPEPLDEAGFAEDPSTGLMILVGGCTATACPSATPWGFGPTQGVGLTLDPATCGNATLAGVALASGAVAELQNGTYPLRVGACSNYQIANVTTGPLLVLNGSAPTAAQWTGTVLVLGEGTILVNLTHVASNSSPGGLAAISVLGLTFLELLLIGVALAAVLGLFVALKWTTRRRVRPPKT